MVSFENPQRSPAFSMELLHPTGHRFPAIVISSHRPFSSDSLANQRKTKKKKKSAFICNFDALSFRRTATQLVSPHHASASNSTLFTQEPDTPFRSSFDEYLKAMESVKTLKVGIRERKKDPKVEFPVESDDQSKAIESIHTRKTDRKDRENREKGIKGKTGSGGVSGKLGLKDSIRVEVEYNLKKAYESEERKRGIGLKRTIPDRYDLDESHEDDGLHSRSRISKMEMEERIQKLARW